MYMTKCWHCTECTKSYLWASAGGRVPRPALCKRGSNLTAGVGKERGAGCRGSNKREYKSTIRLLHYMVCCLILVDKDHLKKRFSVNHIWFNYQLIDIFSLPMQYTNKGSIYRKFLLVFITQINTIITKKKQRF